MLFQEYISLGVRADLPVKTGAEFLAELKKDPKKFSIGVATAAGNHNHLGIATAAKAAGVSVKDLRTVIFSTGGEAKTALVGGHIDALSTSPAVLLDLFEANKVRILAVTSPDPLDPPFDKVPTWKSQGVDTEFGAWRGAVSPPGLSTADTAEWDKLIEALLKTKTWAELANKNQWSTVDKDAAAFKAFVDAEEKSFESLLTEMGLAKK